MNTIPKLLSKTKLIKGYRCLKCIYLTIHRPELEAPITPETQALFDQGNEVGAKAREYFPNGILVDNKPWDFSGAIERTRKLLASNTPVIYEAAFEHMGCYTRPDVIQYSPESKRWKIFEVKSTTKVKPEHYDDIGLQAWIIANGGLPIEQINLVHLNAECRYPDLSNLFTIVDVTQEIRDRYFTIKPKLAEIFSAIRQSNIPDIDIGEYCLTPTKCGFKDYCWQKIPTMSVFNLPGIRNRKWDFYNDGTIKLDDPRLSDLNDIQERVVTCFKTGERFVDYDAIRIGISEWKYPLIFLDFETINPAIPRYDGIGPYQHVAFQFSAHIWKSPDSAITHKEYLHEKADDPRPTLITALLDACGESGSIVAYYSKFEAGQIKALADYSTEHREALLKLRDRLVDPLTIIREAIYDNAFAGSFSLKKVAPALLGSKHSYENMDIADGSAAQRAFEELISPNTSNSRKRFLKNALLEYCKKDTLVMVELVTWLMVYSSRVI
ncbi:MAG: DUF2779 domain-containing protein [Gammaproteobacteria bacterium]|nr:DUF2779 domain-containing protein [Gammaproteobacteria bacterium]MCW5582457.1 DUF2779 domain-containing protein [Gammaproteobacteria bacterium]